MKHYSHHHYTELIKNAEVLSRDKFGDKVLQLRDGTMLKLFRVKNLFSSARIIPYSVRFRRNVKRLSGLNIPTVTVTDIFNIPAIKRFAVHYRPLEGTTLRLYLTNNRITPQMAGQLARFMAELHDKGIFFRSIHFGNILVLPNGNFGLIDVSDMKIRHKPLNKSKRIRNFHHFTRYDMDQHALVPELETFVRDYLDASHLSRRKAKIIKAEILNIYNPQKMNRSTRIAFFLYTLAWKAASPILRLNRRLSQGFPQRTLKQNTLPAADIWIQAASAGESYLAWELLKEFQPEKLARILITSNTKQGMEILDKAVHDAKSTSRNLDAYTAYFPFDSPNLMKAAIQTVKPRLIVLLESEIWPGFLYEAKKFGCKILIINGRMTDKSFKRYLFWHSLWKTLKPDKVLAISKEDARRFKKLFKLDEVEVAPNIKFDRVNLSVSGNPETSALRTVIPQNTPFVVLGSTRREEEKDVTRIIVKLMEKQPNIVIGLFPRHLHRVKSWHSLLNRNKIPWKLRSEAKEKAVSSGVVILWDTFGELNSAYGIAAAVFVGGSLAPLGGQNFLEPLIHGVSPVIGPYWDNFSWVGSEIINQNLVRVAGNWEKVVNLLISDITHPPSRKNTIQKVRKYLSNHQGGTVQATNLINNFLN